MTTGMTTAERWAEVARRVWGGASFGNAVFQVFDDNAENVIGDKGWTHWGFETDDEYDTYYGMLALFLSYEAEDEDAREDCPWKCEADAPHCLCVVPEPVTMVAAEEPVSGFWEDAPEERRSSWNAKLADGMRKWADWVEARF